jgi:DNA-binding FadR family transcriptional regulator
MAAVRQDESIIAAVGRSVEQMIAHLSDLDLFLQENERFHLLVAAAAGNPVFTLLVGSLDAISDGAKFGISFPVTRREAVAAAHEAIYLALKSGDPEESAKVMASHVRAFRRYVEKNHPEAMSSLVRWSDVAP